MRIKRVSIQGFKTFAKRTEFIFDPGVTAIVGPNGSGKSNVVDAIRWCLGEQSFSLLRSKKTSDVIFSGSDHKARLGMAQVSLILDNQGGQLPVDFVEVEITRRAYRDGDNEYLLNGRRVRLQDITELLAQTGLGKRTYALIGQGLIDRILSLAPEELRGLFEEAAGITGYQSKRTTTIRRLDAAQQNLTRVQDIIAEISPRLGYLKRQADRAREREQIAQDLRSLLLEWFGFHWHKTIQELSQGHATVDALKSQIGEIQAELNRHATKIADLRRRQTDLRAQVGGLHQRSSDLHRQAESLGRELAVAQERMRQLQARREAAQQELAPLRLLLETTQSRAEEIGAEIRHWQAEQDARQEAVALLQRDVNARQNDRNRLIQDVASSRRELSRREAQSADSLGRMRQFDERLVEIEREVVAQRAAHAQSSAAVEAHADQLALHEQQQQQRSDEIATLRARLDEIGSRLHAERAEIEQAQQRRQLADREVDRLQTRLDLLARLQREGAGYPSGVRAVIQASVGDSAALRGIVGAVASLIHVPAHLDKAVETALGGAMQNIVTESWSATQTAIEWLKTHRHGRATFLPLDRLNVLPAIPAPQQPGILGNACDLVDFDLRIETAVEQLLNRVWIAKDLPAARHALDQVRSGPRPTVVTLDGEIIRPGGAVTGGSDRERRDESILARERELRDLPAAINKATQNADGLAKTCRALTEKIEQTAAGVEPVQARLDELAQLDAEGRNRLEATRRELDRARQSALWQEQRCAELATESQTIVEQKALLAERVAQLHAEAEAIGMELAQSEAASSQTGADVLLQQMAELRASLAEAETTLQSKRSLLDNQQRNGESTESQIAAKTRQIETFSHEAGDLAQQIQTLDAREQTLNRAIAALQVELNPAEIQIKTWETEQAAAEQHERTAQENLRRSESLYNSAQLQYQRTDDRLVQLRRQIEQDIGLVMLETTEDLAYQPPLPWEAVVERLPIVDELGENVDNEVRELRARLSRVSNVNPDAPREYAEAAERHGHLLTQSQDLEAAITDLRKVIRELDEVMETELTKTFGAVAEQFVHFFRLLFNGGSARLVLAEPDDITNSGIEIIARPPGKRPQSLALLSGGERTLAACALIFAILRVSPTPFCILDEVDAALDEANVDRFRFTLGELSQDTQFIVITHNRRTLEGTNAIYGITMASDGTSRVISLRLEGEHMVSTGDADAVTGSESAEVGDAKQIDELEELVKL